MTSKPDNSTRELPVLQIAPPGAACYKEISNLVAGAKAAPWLPDFLFNWAISLELDRHVDARLPGRAEMRKILRAISDAAALIRRGLGAAEVQNFLEDDPLGPISYRGLLDHALRNLAFRADRASKSPRLADAKGRTKAGQGRATASRSFSPQVYCALLICEVWVHFNRQYPTVGNRKAAQAAEVLWCAAGKKRQGWGSDPLTAWRHHLKTVRALTNAEDLRADLQRRLSTQARDWERWHQPDDEPGGN